MVKKNIGWRHVVESRALHALQCLGIMKLLKYLQSDQYVSKVITFEYKHFTII